MTQEIIPPGDGPDRDNAEDIGEDGKPVGGGEQKPGDEATAHKKKKGPYPNGKGIGKDARERIAEDNRKRWLPTVTERWEDKFHKAPPTEEERMVVRTLVFAGYTEEAIAKGLRISRHQLRTHFEDELEHGRMMMVGKTTAALVERAWEGSDVAAIFLLKTRGAGNFSEKLGEAERFVDENADSSQLPASKKQELVQGIVSLIKQATKPQATGEKK